MRLGLTFDLQTDPMMDERQAEFDPPSTIEALRRALESLGHRVTLIGSAEDLVRDGAGRWHDVELVFNIAEGRHGRCREAWVPTLLELFGLPYVGSDAVALAIGLDKVMCKRLAVAADIPTPRWMTLERQETVPEDLPVSFPVIVKPRWEGSGRAIDAGAVVRTRAELAERVQQLAALGTSPWLVEEFVPFGELTVFVMGNDPPTAYPAIQRPLDPVTRLAFHVVQPAPTSWLAPVVLDDALDAAARRMALRMFEMIGCRDVARVDFRVDEQGRLFFLEINPLPSCDPEGTMGWLAEYLGVTYAQFIGRVLESACRRLGLTDRYHRSVAVTT